MKKGFTLIEVIIYIALFSILIGTAFVTAFQLIDSANKLNTKTILQEEGNFVMRKLNWAMTGLDSSFTPSIVTYSACNQKITLHKLGYPLNPIEIRLNTASSTIEFIENGGSPTPITTENVSVTCLQFVTIPATGTGPSGLKATTTISGIDFTITKYQRI